MQTDRTDGGSHRYADDVNDLAQQAGHRYGGCQEQLCPSFFPIRRYDISHITRLQLAGRLCENWHRLLTAAAWEAATVMEACGILKQRQQSTLQVTASHFDKSAL